MIPSELTLGAYDRSNGFTEYTPIVKTEVTVPECIGELERPARKEKLKVPAQYVVTLDDAICIPRQVIIQGDKLLPDTFRRLNPKMNHVQLAPLTEDVFRLTRPQPAPNYISDKCFYFDGEHADHFGHFTLEVLSRLWPFPHLDPSQYLFVTSAKPHPNHAELLRPFGIHQSQIHYFKEPIRCKSLTVSSQGYLLERSVSDQALKVWKTISDFYSGGPAIDRLYVSRANWTKQRNLINEAAIEAKARSLGYQVISPERLSIDEQINIFSRAKMIAGPSGSGLYNCIYSATLGERLILASSKFVTMNDTVINRSTGSKILYLTGAPVRSDVSPMLADWSIDANLVFDYLGRYAT